MKNAVVAALMLGLLFVVVDRPGRAGEREASRTAEVLKLLEETIDMQEFQNPMSLKEAIGLFYEKILAQTKGRELPILVDLEAFKAVDADLEVYEAWQIKFPPYPKRMSVAVALRLAIGKIPSGDPTFIVRDGHVEVTTRNRTTTEFLLKHKVRGVFNKQPLADALLYLAEQSGASIVLDQRLTEQAKTPISAIFRGDVTLENALTIFTDMADLNWVRLSGAIYVTTPTRARALEERAKTHPEQPEKMPVKQVEEKPTKPEPPVQKKPAEEKTLPEPGKQVKSRPPTDDENSEWMRYYHSLALRGVMFRPFGPFPGTTYPRPQPQIPLQVPNPPAPPESSP